MSALAKSLDRSISLVQAAEAADISLVQARRFLAAIALLPREDGDEILADARRDAVRVLSSSIRKNRQ